MSAVVVSLGSPLIHRVEFHPDRRKAAVLGSAAMVTGILIAYPATAQQISVQGLAETVAAAVALVGATVLIGMGAYLFLRLLLWRGAAVVIDSRGIQDRRAGGAVMPWSAIHDIRVLDRHGHHIAIETLAESIEERTAPNVPLPRPARAHRTTVIDTFFLRSITGNPLLDFVMPLTAMAPIDMSETPVSEDTLAADARQARLRSAAIALFILGAGIVPAIAAATLLLV